MLNKSLLSIVLIAIYLVISFMSLDSMASNKSAGPGITEAIDQLESEYLKSKKTTEHLVEAISKKIPSMEDKRKFDSLQKMWKKFAYEDAALSAHFTSGGGSAYSMDYLSNLLELYHNRIKSLNAIAWSLHAIKSEDK